MRDGEHPTDLTDAAAAKAAASALVWDLPTRLFHWLLVVGVVIAWLTGGTGDRWHETIGFAVAGLVAFRLVWGFAGSRHSKFSDFATSPRGVWRYLQDIARNRAPRHVGHNPAGGAMILALIATLVTIAVSGTMMTTSRFFGIPWVETLHSLSVDALLILIPIHVLGVLVGSWMHQENLISAMLTGWKKDVGTTSGARGDENELLTRVRGTEGMIFLSVLVFAGAAYGWSLTSGRSAAPSTSDDRAIVTMAPVTAQEGEIARALQERVQPKERQDYVQGGPAEPSKAWLISSGGRLYDNWMAALALSQPSVTHPAWPRDNTSMSGAATWRCKSCHGWDYLGRDGQNKSGPNATRIVGIQRLRNKEPDQVIRILGNATHRFTDEMLPFDAKYRLALFVTQGQHSISRYIEADGRVKGDARLGAPLFQNVCAACHGFDGKARRLGISNDPLYNGPPLYVGSKAATNPTEILHKLRNGHPGAVMVSLRPFPVEYAANLLAYLQTLPRQ